MIKYRAFVDGFVIEEVELPSDNTQNDRNIARKLIAVRKQIPQHYIRLKRKTIDKVNEY